MVNSLLRLNILLFLLLRLQSLKISSDLLHLLDRVTFTSQQEPLVLHALTRFYIRWNLVAKLLVVNLAMAGTLFTLLVQTLVNIESAQ